MYFYWRVYKTRKATKRETQDLKKKFYKEYNELKTDIEHQLEAFKKAKGQRPLSEAEKAQEKRLLENLADVEKVLKEELKDIEETI